MSTLGGVLVGLIACGSQSKPIDWKQVDRAMGRPGTAPTGGVYRYSFPHSDLAVTVRGIPVKPAFSLGSHVEFLPAGDGAMVMGTASGRFCILLSGRLFTFDRLRLASFQESGN